MATNQSKPTTTAFTQAFGPLPPAIDYMIDAAQRTVLFWDVLRERGNQYREHAAKFGPHVLSYAFEVIIDGRTFERPVNYVLVRIIPPEGVEIDADPQTVHRR